MGDFGSILNTALGVLSLATLAGLGLLRGTVLNLREQLKDSREETSSLRASRTDDHTKIAQLSADLAALGRVVTGEAHWTAIGDQLEEHHTRATIHWERDEQLLNRILDELRKDKP